MKLLSYKQLCYFLAHPVLTTVLCLRRWGFLEISSACYVFSRWRRSLLYRPLRPIVVGLHNKCLLSFPQSVLLLANVTCIQYPTLDTERVGPVAASKEERVSWFYTVSGKTSWTFLIVA